MVKREIEEGLEEEGTIRKRGRSFYRLEETHRRKVGGAGPSYVAALFFQGSCEPTPSHRRAFTARHSTSRIEISRVSIARMKRLPFPPVWFRSFGWRWLRIEKSRRGEKKNDSTRLERAWRNLKGRILYRDDCKVIIRFKTYMYNYQKFWGIYCICKN